MASARSIGPSEDGAKGNPDRTMATTRGTLPERLSRFPTVDRRLVKAFIVMAMVSLTSGVATGLITGLIKGGALTLPGTLSYQVLTLHAGTVFFYWLYFVQIAIVLSFIMAYTKGVKRLAWRSLGWLGLLLMVGGFLANQVAVLQGAAVLYDAKAPLSAQFEGAALYYIGYVLLAAGLICCALMCIASAVRPKTEGRVQNWSAITFASTLWAGLLLVTSVAALNVFVPSARWALAGGGQLAFDYTEAYNVFFHNMHYLPLMSTVLVWYVLAEVSTGVKSIFSDRFSKVVFSIYLLIVPPTMLYHMFLEPDITPLVKVVGSILSIVISIPTILVFIIIVVSLEASARARGSRGLFGWIRALPWSNPAFACVGIATLCAAAGGVVANVLIQEKLSSLLSDTFTIPAYFHFFTVGTVSLTFIGGLIYLVPILWGRQLWRPRVLARLPYLLALGVFLFGVAGVAAGMLGAPRRTLVTTYDVPAIWSSLMVLVGIGATIMAIALFGLVYGLAVTAVRGAKAEHGQETANLPVVTWRPAVPGSVQAYSGTISVAIMLVAILLLTTVAFRLLEALPG